MNSAIGFSAPWGPEGLDRAIEAKMASANLLAKIATSECGHQIDICRASSFSSSPGSALIGISLAISASPLSPVANMNRRGPSPSSLICRASWLRYVISHAAFFTPSIALSRSVERKLLISLFFAAFGEKYIEANIAAGPATKKSSIIHWSSANARSSGFLSESSSSAILSATI